MARPASIAGRFPCGGWCPAGRKAEDGPIPARYPPQDLPGAGYLQRTRKNVEGSDGTLIVTFGAATVGTLRTVQFCQQLGKLHLVIDASQTSESSAAAEIARFVKEREIKVLNVAVRSTMAQALGLKGSEPLPGIAPDDLGDAD